MSQLGSPLDSFLEFNAGLSWGFLVILAIQAIQLYNTYKTKKKLITAALNASSAIIKTE